MANRNSGARRSRKSRSDASETRRADAKRARVRAADLAHPLEAMRQARPHEQPQATNEASNTIDSTLQDITRAKQALDVLRDSNTDLARNLRERTKELADDRNFMSAVLETVPALIVVLDNRCRVARTSKEAEALSGRRHEDVVGRSIFEIGLIPKEEADAVRKVFARLRAGDPPIRHEHHWQSADGSKHLIAWTTAALRDADGGIGFFIKAGVDVTDQRRAETEARAHQATLLHAHRTIAAGELAGALAHEVNQPLTAIANLCEATLQQVPDADVPAGVAKNLRAIAAQALRAGNVIRDLRSFVAAAPSTEARSTSMRSSARRTDLWAPKRRGTAFASTSICPPAR